MKALCDWCGRELWCYSHEGCPDGRGADEMPTGLDSLPDPWEALLKASEGPEPER